MPRRRRSAWSCLAITTGIDEGLFCFEKGGGPSQSSSPTPITKPTQRYATPSSKSYTPLDADLTARADKRPATPSKMDAQRQTAKKSSSRKVPETSAPRLVSRSSSMQVEDGREVSTTETSSESQGKGDCDSLYNIDRWLSQKPSEEPWHDFRR
jgi:hypothetical protein